MQQQATEKRTLTVVEAAEVLGLSRNAAYEAIRRGELPALRFGRRVVVPRAAIDKMLAEAAA
jgi:excisionase family DNA binding protein